jgi:hypothetical protein
MILISDLIKEFKSDFLSQYGHCLSEEHFKAMSAMEKCRTNESPCLLVKCNDCGHSSYLHHSCGHRSCPHCQNHECQKWIEKQVQKQVPAQYFMITFTVPAEFRGIIWRNQKEFYSLMFECAWDTLRTFAKNDPKLGGTAGGIAVLHTHSRASDFHPHIHFIIPALTVDTKTNQWHEKKGNYLFCDKALKQVFRAKFLAGIQREKLPFPERYPKQWVVHIKPVGTGEKALIYLGRYLYRGVIQEKDILQCENGEVTYQYQDSNTKKYVIKKLSGKKFLWQILLHIPPKRFRRARNYGFLHPNSKKVISILHYFIKWTAKALSDFVKKMASKLPKVICEKCGGEMEIVKTQLPFFMARLE